MSDKDYKYCPLMKGDGAYTRYLYTVEKFWLQKPKCHISKPLDCNEATDLDEYETVLGTEYELKNFIEL
jgi:hypothetical protein